MNEADPIYAKLLPGDPAPWFHQRSPSNPNFAFDSVAGRYIVLGFYGSAGDERGRSAIEAVFARRGFFDDERASFFGVSLDPRDESENRVANALPGLRFFWDFDGRISRLYGAIPKNADPPNGLHSRRFWIVLNPMLRVIKVVLFRKDGAEIGDLFTFLEGLPPPSRFAGFEIPAPILVLPDVFEPTFCQNLIGLYEVHGGKESGFMRDVGDKTVAVSDPGHKRRKDYTIQDATLIEAIQARIRRRVIPEVFKVHHFKATRMERYIVSCYAAEYGGHFRAHRDNTTRATAHRRFAVSINLNEDFEGGEISFPEYGPRSYKAPVGGAVIFSAPLLHAVSKVARGRRYAFLPFLYDDEAARTREENNRYLGEGVGAYKAVRP